MELIDTHCHLDARAFDADREQVIANARRGGVRDFIVPAIDAAGWAGLLDLCRTHTDCHPALGLHPVFLDRHQGEHLDNLERALERERPLAVGEIGLDFFHSELDHGRQRTLLEGQLALAAHFHLPVLLHVRKAHEEVLRALRQADVPGGIIHAFNGSLQQAHRYLELGFKLGFGGMLTFERSRRLRELARALPPDALVLETDAPDMTVAAHRGDRNSPEYLPDCLNALAVVRGESPEAMANLTTDNARRVLGL